MTGEDRKAFEDAEARTLNSQRAKLAGALRDLWDAVIDAVLPILGPVVELMNRGLQSMSRWWNKRTEP